MTWARLPHWLRSGLPLVLGPLLLLEVVFPWRFAWGDVQLSDRGPWASPRFEVEFGDVALRTGAVRNWRLPGVPGRGLVLDLTPLYQALAAHEDARVELKVRDAQGERACTVRGRRDLLLGKIEPRIADVVRWGRSESPVSFELRVEIGVPGDVRVALRGAEPPR